MMLDHLGEPEAGKAIVTAIETVLAEEAAYPGPWRQGQYG
jgi:isocitrate/isopropylmalate dehydrogenase